MMHVRAEVLPDDALLARYRPTPGNPEAYVDCFAARIARAVSLEEFVAVFYTTPLFRAERWILRVAVGRPSSDDDVRALAAAQTQQFAAWSVEDRSDHQLLMCDMASRTRSWFMVRPAGEGTRLYFGSAVVPRAPSPGEVPRMAFAFRLLLGFHKLYSRALLAGALRRLASVRPS